MDQRIRAIAEQCSQGKTGVNELDLLHLRPYVEGFLDPHWLSERLNEYEAWASANSDPFLQRSLLHRPLGMNMLVASIWAARSWENIYIEDPSFWPPGGAKRLINIACSLAVLELHAGTMLDSSALEHLRQRLQASDQLWGIIHECGLFAHLINRGAEVEPRFLRKADPMDIIVRWRGQQVPVQCKSKRPGAGRVISQDVFTMLAGSVARDGVDGFVVPIRSVEALKEKIVFLYDNPEAMVQMGLAARKRVEEFTWDRYGLQVISAYRRIVGSDG